MRLCKNLTLSEVIKSQTAIRMGIDNQPTKEALDNLKRVAEDIFQPCRDLIGGPLFVSSGYRSPALNAAIGGSRTSSHMKGEALDVDCDFFGTGKNSDLFYHIRKNLEFDQLIWEFGDSCEPAWIHVSKRKENNRGEVLRAFRGGDGRTFYKYF